MKDSAEVAAWGEKLNSAVDALDTLSCRMDSLGKKRADASGAAVVKYGVVEDNSGNRNGFRIKVRAFRNGRLVGTDDNRMIHPTRERAMQAAKRSAEEVNDRELDGEGKLQEE